MSRNVFSYVRPQVMDGSPFATDMFLIFRTSDKTLSWHQTSSAVIEVCPEAGDFDILIILKSISLAGGTAAE